MSKDNSSMIEMRWVRLGGERQLQYRFVTPNASGALCPPGDWSDWQRVPEVEHVQPGYGGGAQWISLTTAEQVRGWYCEKCGLGYAEYIACEEADCGPLIFVPPDRRPDQQVKP